MNDEQNEQPKTEEQQLSPLEQTIEAVYEVAAPQPETQLGSGVEFVPAAPMPVKKAKKPKRETKGEQLQNAAQEVLDAVEEARKAADDLDSKFGELRDELADAKDDLENAISQLEERLENLRSIREVEYQSWYDNMPESLQQGPTGEKLSTLLEIDLDQSVPEVPELPELDEVNFDDIENAAQEVMDADLPLGFGRD
jgi:chromosome segregation ATPase